MGRMLSDKMECVTPQVGFGQIYRVTQTITEASCFPEDRLVTLREY